jgi:hypothetical protein
MIERLTNPVVLLLLVIPAATFPFLYRLSIRDIRNRCGPRRAEWICLVGTIAAFVIAEAGILIPSIVVSLIAFAVAVAANIFPDALIRAVGGADAICLLRREMSAIFDLFKPGPVPDAAVREAQAHLAALERYRTAESAPVIEAMHAFVETQLATGPDHEATHRALDRLDTAVATLKTAHPW